MAYRIQNLETMTVHEVDAIFLRARGLGATLRSETEEGPESASRFGVDPALSQPEIVDDQLEGVR